MKSNLRCAVKSLGWPAVILVVCATSTTHAHELNTFIGASFTHSDNPLLLPSPNQTSDEWWEPSIRIDYQLDFTSFDATLQYEVSRLEYKEDSSEDRTDVLGLGTFRWTIMDQRLFWDFYQNRNRVTLDSALPDIPSNETERNVVQTGPTLWLRYGNSGQLQLSATYVDTSIDEVGSVENSQARISADISQDIGTRTRIGLVASWSDVSSNFEIQEYEAQRVGITLSGTGRQSSYNATVGQNRIERETGGLTFDGAFYSIAWSLIQTNARWRLSANQELTDSSIGLSLNGNVENPLDNGDAGIGTFDIVQRDRYEAGVEFDVIPERGAVDIQVFQDESDYKTLAQDTESLGAIVALRYSFSPRTRLLYRYEWSNEEFQRGPLLNLLVEESTDNIQRLDINYTPNTQVNFTIWVSENKRHYETGDVRLKEISTGITLEYRI